MPDPTLTDEELAWEEACHRPNPAHPAVCDACAGRWPCRIARLIAALRASREDLRIANEATLVLAERAAKAERELRRLRHGPVGDDAAGGDL